MQISDVIRLIFKSIFGKSTESEQAALEAWLNESQTRRALYHKLHSPPFIQKAITDDNRALRKSVRKGIILQTKSLRVLQWRRRMVRVAAVLSIPIAVAAIGWIAVEYLRPATGPTVSEALLINPGSPKVVVTLPNGEEMEFGDHQDVSFVKDGHSVVNQENTISLTAETSPKNSAQKPEQFVTYTVPSGGEYTVKLEDGTTVTLNSESELRAPASFGKGPRTVYFKGEGYFEVAHDASHPFMVKAERADITVLGTQFNIMAYENDYETVATLVSGTVSLRHGSDTQVTMVPGTQARVRDNGSVAIEAVDVYPYTAWQSGRIVFVNTRLEEIMKVLKRWYNCEVHFGDEAVKERRFTMDIPKYDDITEVLYPMQKVNVSYEIKGNEIFLYSK